MKYYILYNPLAHSGHCEEYVKNIKLPSDSERILSAMTGDKTHREVLKEIDSGDKVILCGGDGTLNRFVNSVSGMEIKNDIYFVPAGSGNDFLNDIGKNEPDKLIKINDYLRNLPVLCINDKAYHFINGVGYGIDGYCCKEVNRLKSLSKKASYALIALKGLLYAYKPTGATLIIDGVEHRYEKVWLSPIMKGKFFGGGMMIAPNQDRSNEDNSLTVVVAHNLSTLRILTLFPTIFKGNHIKYTKYIDVHKGHNISVKFDIPAPLQIDGETLEGVNEYSVKATADETKLVTSILK